MTEQWPYWVACELQDDGTWKPNRETLSEGQNHAIVCYSLKIGDVVEAIKAGTVDVRQCRIEMKP